VGHLALGSSLEVSHTPCGHVALGLCLSDGTPCAHMALGLLPLGWALPSTRGAWAVLGWGQVVLESWLWTQGECVGCLDP